MQIVSATFKTQQQHQCFFGNCLFFQDRIRSGTLTEKLSQIVRLHVSSTLNDDTICCESTSTAAETKDGEITKKKSNCSTTPQQPFTTLNSYELQLIADIERSMTAHFVDESRLEVVGYAAKISDCFNASAVFIRQVIKLCKSAVGFRRLPVEDQLILLKVFYPAVMTARAAFFYRPDLDGYPVATVCALLCSCFFCCSSSSRLIILVPLFVNQSRPRETRPSLCIFPSLGSTRKRT